MFSINRRRAIVLGVSAGAVLAGGRGAMAATSASIAQSAAQTGYVAPLVAFEKNFIRDEGLDLSIVVSGGGTKNRDMVAAGEADFGLGDSTHALQMTNRGRPAKLMMGVDKLCVYAIIAIRKDLYDAGITSLESLAAWKRPDGSKPVIGVPSIGGGSQTYASFILEAIGKGDALNWVAVGLMKTMLGALSTKQVDAIVPTPSWLWEAEAKGWGNAIFDATDDATWSRIFGGPVPATSIYLRQTTIDSDRGKVQAFANALARSLAWIKASEPAEIYDLVGPKYFPELERGTALRELETYKKAFNYTGLISEDDYKRGGAVWFRPSTQINPISFAEGVDNSFMQSAQAKG